MKSNMIFFDIDGTILSHRDFHISDSTIEAIKAAQANGHLAFVNTGRTIAEIENKITDIGFDGYICGCGTYISYQDRVLLHHTIPSDMAQRLIKDLHKYKIEALLEGFSAVYYDEHTANPRLIRFREEHIRHGFCIRDWEDPDISFNKLCMIVPEEAAYLNLYRSYQNYLDFIDRGNYFYEVVPAGYSKATGIRFLEEKLGIPHENTYALGDSANDLSMLYYVKHSIAMENSCKEVLDMASFLTLDVDEGGVTHALRHYHMI